MIRIIRKARGQARLLKGDGMCKPFVALVATYGNRSTRTVEVPPKVQVIFHFAEVRQDLVVAPPGRAVGVRRRDRVEIEYEPAPQIAQAVERARLREKRALRSQRRRQ